MLAQLIVHLAFGLNLLAGSGGAAMPAVVAQAAAQVTPTANTQRAEARVAATNRALSKRVADKQKLSRVQKQQLAQIDRLKRQRASWNRDRQIRSLKAEAHATGRELALVSADIRRLRAQLLAHRRALIATIDRELSGTVPSVRQVALISLRSKTVAKLPRKKVRRIVIPDDRIEDLAEPEELEEQVRLLERAERQLLREQRSLERREARYARMATLRSERVRAGELDQFEADSVRRTAGSRSGGAKRDRGGGSGADLSDGDRPSSEADPAPPEEPGGSGTPNTDLDDGGGFEAASVVLADVVDAGTVDALRRAERSTNPKTKARAAGQARKQVEDKLRALRERRARLEARAREMRRR